MCWYRANENGFSRRLKAASVEFRLRTGSGRLFQADGPAMAKTRGRPYVLSRWRGTCNRFRSAERRCLSLDSGTQWTARYRGARPFRHRWTTTMTCAGRGVKTLGVYRTWFDFIPAAERWRLSASRQQHNVADWTKHFCLHWLTTQFVRNTSAAVHITSTSPAMSHAQCKNNLILILIEFNH